MEQPVVIKLIPIVCAIIVSGCTTYVPVKTPFPRAPEALIHPCDELAQVAPGAEMSDLTDTVVQNYARYHACSALEGNWINWYNAQSQIVNTK